MTPKKLGRYELLRVIGKGAMGVVYEGRDPNLERRVAIKTVKVENLSEEAAAEYEHRFRTEARSAARLQHPNIVSVYDSDRDADVAFLVMEYIQGDDLKHHLDRGTRYSLEQSLKIIRDLLSALDYAHKQGIVHRDIKPANLLLEPGGRVKLTDFGVARIQDSGEATRTQGSMIGTLKYMAPEQVQGQKIDSRADLFSVGVVLYQLLTDKRPFDGDNDFSIIHQIIGHNPAAPSSINAKLPTALDAVVARSLAKDREDRFATARDFAVALQAAIRRAGDQTVLPPPNPNRKTEPALSRPLTAPGTVPGGVTTPSVGTVSSVTQELELVYWKDVKDASDPEELQGFLEKFPAGIYADLARRRLRWLSAGDQTVAATGTQSGLGMSTFASSTAFPDTPATSTDAARPVVSEGSPELRPTNWVEEEYTRTLAQTREATGSEAPSVPGGPAVPPPAAAIASVEPPAVSAAPAPPAAPVDAPVASVGAAMPATAPAPSAAKPPAGAGSVSHEGSQAAKKKAPVAVLAVLGALVAAGALALVMGKGQAPDTAGAAAGAGAPAVTSASGFAPAAPAATVVANAPADAPVTLPAAPAAAPAAASGPAAAAASSAAQAAQLKADKAAAARKAAASQARAARVAAAQQQVTPEPAVRTPPPPVAPPRIDPEPVAPRPQASTVTAATAGNYAAVDQCRERMFLSKELCLAEHCDKPGARNHPLCVKRRADAKLREESKQMQAR